MQSEYGNPRPKKKNQIEESPYGKMAPQAPEIERALLGGAILEPSIIEDLVGIITKKEAFYSEPHQIIFQALIDMFDAGRSIDFITLGEHLKRAGQLELIGGNYYIISLTSDVVSGAHIEEHARILMEHYIMRELIKYHANGMAEAYDPTKDAFDLIDSASKFLMEINDTIIRRQYTMLRKSVMDMLSETATLMKKEVPLTGVPSGYKELDRITGGWRKTDFIILAARPSVGKTAFLLNIALNAARDEYLPTGVGIFSLEMNSQQLTQRIMANISDISLKKIKEGNLTESEFAHLSEAGTIAANLPIFIDDTATLTIVELRAKARRMKKVNNVGLIIVDYLQLMSGDLKNGTREQEISRISRELKKLAKTLEIPIIALSQLSRAIEGRASKKPQLSDLRDSGAIEQDADIVAFLYRHPEEYLKKNPYKGNERNLDLAKHRDGELATFIADFDGSLQRFYNLEVSIEDVPHEDIPPAIEPRKQIPVPRADVPGRINPDYTTPRIINLPYKDDSAAPF